MYGKPILESEPKPQNNIDPAIEREYALRARHPERGAIYEGFARRSEQLRASVAGFRTLRYAESAPCAIDFFPAPGARKAPLFIFIHGGYWRALERSNFSFLAAPWIARGAHVALIGYELAP